MRTSARNQFEGMIVSVEKGAVGAIVKIKVDKPVMITAFITKDAVDDLDLKNGDRATAFVKSTEVIIAKGT